MDFKKIFHLSVKTFSLLSLLLTLHSPTALSEDGEDKASALGSSLFKSFLSGLGLDRDKLQEAYRPPFAPDSVAIHGHPRNNEIINNVNNMTSGFVNTKYSLTGSFMNFSTDCARPKSMQLFGELDNMQLCNKSGLYREDYMRPMMDGGKRSPEFYMLRLDPNNAASYCACVRQRGARYNVSGPVNSVQNMEKRRKLIDNLLKTGMDKLARRFNAIAPDVMYALTSMEMSALHLSEKTVKDEAGERKTYTQKSVLNACAPGQFGSLMYDMIKNDGEQGALCSMAGAKRLGQGFVSGKSLDCEGEKMNEPHCQDRSSRGLLLQTEINPHQAIREIGNYISDAGALESTEKFLNRHHTLLKNRGRLEQANIPPVYDHELMLQERKERMEEWRKFRESGQQGPMNSERRSAWKNENTELIQNALFNEISHEGRELWKENNAPILKALELYKINGEISDDQISSDLDYFREHIAHNPYLAKHFPGVQGKSNEELKKDVIKYVTESLAPKFDYVKRGSESEDSMEELFQKDDVLDDINAAMFLTYRDHYKETVQECEDIQKTLISLCQAATNYSPRVERISDFFTDPLLIELYQEYDEDAYAGRDSYQADDMITATGMFCHELSPADRIQDINNESLARQHLLNETPFLEGVRDLRKFLTNLGSDSDKVWKDHRQDYYRKENGVDVVPAKVASNEESVLMEVKVFGSGDNSNSAYIRPTSSTTRNDLANGKDVAKVRETNIFESGEIPKAIPVNEDDLQPIKVKSAAVQANPEEAKTEATPTIRADLLPPNSAVNSSFSDKFSNITPLNQEQGDFDAQNDPSQENSSANVEGQELAVDPVQAELLSQLERMRAREQEMAQQIAELKNTMEEEEDQRMVAKYEQEQAALRQKVESLTTQLNERKIEQEKPKVTSTPSQGFDGTLGGSRGRSSTASAPRVQPTSGANSQQASAPSAPASVPQNINRSAPSSFLGSSNLAGGNLGLTSQTVQSSAVRSSGPRSQMGSIVSVDTNLASIAQSVEGNTALRQTADPQILEKIIFKEVDGEIVFENGEPVIERTELLTLEEAQMLEEQEALAQAELLKEEEANERAPASIEEEMEAIEQSLYPRSRTYTVEELADELRRGKSLQDE